MKALPICLLFLLLLSACDKGYEVRFTNYYTEPVDSVVVGVNKVVFQDVAFKQTTGYQPLAKGKYGVTIISRSKKIIYGSVEIPATGTGKYTIQVDGIKQVAQLQDELKN